MAQRLRRTREASAGKTSIAQPPPKIAAGYMLMFATPT